MSRRERSRWCHARSDHRDQGHYLAGLSSNPQTVVITGPQDLLNGINSIQTSSIFLTGIVGVLLADGHPSASARRDSHTEQGDHHDHCGVCADAATDAYAVTNAVAVAVTPPHRDRSREVLCAASSATPVPVPLLRSCSTACGRLEYRGYDSAGIAIIDASGDVTTVRNTHKVDDLARQVEAAGQPEGTVGIGHTRWATHGRPSVENAHPHQDCTGRIHVIHNGIVENYRELRAELMARGHEFLSETDTEVVPHLIEDNFHGDLTAAVRIALNRMEGACALVVISADQPDRVVGARVNAPLVVGLGRGEVFVSSDITALIPYTKRIALLGEGEIVTATPDGISVEQLDGTAVEARVVTVDWEAEQAQKNGYPHFLLKEIHEQPEAVRNALRGRIDDLGMVVLPELGLERGRLEAVREVVLVACGTAWYAAMVAGYAIEHLAKVRCKVEAASEFRYGEALVDEHSLVIAVSQSGETADTLAAVRQAHHAGAQVIAITNVVGSALSLEADGALYMQAGPEISVAGNEDLHDPDGVRAPPRAPSR